MGANEEYMTTPEQEVQVLIQEGPRRRSARSRLPFCLRGLFALWVPVASLRGSRIWM